MDAAAAARECIPCIVRSSLPEDDSPTGKKHLLDMVVQIHEWDLTDPKNNCKAMRWLGWIQCAIVVGRGATLEQMKEINKKA